jgi:hypothetical protein
MAGSRTASEDAVGKLHRSSLQRPWGWWQDGVPHPLWVGGWGGGGGLTRPLHPSLWQQKGQKGWGFDGLDDNPPH